MAQSVHGSKMKQSNDINYVFDTNWILGEHKRTEELLTSTKRRRILGEQRAAQRVAAWRFDESARRFLAQQLIDAMKPFHFEGSHESITHGGFIGCIRCGSGVSTQPRVRQLPLHWSHRAHSSSCHWLGSPGRGAAERGVRAVATACQILMVFF